MASHMRRRVLLFIQLVPGAVQRDVVAATRFQRYYPATATSPSAKNNARSSSLSIHSFKEDNTLSSVINYPPETISISDIIYYMKLALLLPGYVDSPDYLHFKTFEKRLTRLGYKVVRLDPCDLWKTGEGSTYTVTNYLRDIKKTIETEKKHSPEEIVLIGHSLGGFVSLIAGAQIPEVSKIVALCPPANIAHSLRKWNGNDVRNSHRDLPEIPQENRSFAIPVSFIDDAKQYSALKAVEKIDKPLMIFIGLEDDVVLPEVTEQLVNAANNPYVVRKKGIGHDFRRSEDECMIVMDEIEKFLT